MALEELISLENIICADSKVNLKTTYTILDMKLSKLFGDVIIEVEKGILPILEMQILTYTLRSVVFKDEIEGSGILIELCKCLKQKLYTHDSRWSLGTILTMLKTLRSLITHDIIINGSLIWYLNEIIDWKLDPPIFIPFET